MDLSFGSTIKVERNGLDRSDRIQASTTGRRSGIVLESVTV